jgi:hypothetical protein
MRKAVFGIAKSEAQSVSIFNQLMAAGFVANDISVPDPDLPGKRRLAHEQRTRASEGAAVCRFTERNVR